MHRGVDLSVEEGIADLALCHLGARQVGQEGDIIVGISPAPASAQRDASDPSVEGVVWPKAYNDVVRRISPRRAAVWAFMP